MHIGMFVLCYCCVFRLQKCPCCTRQNRAATAVITAGFQRLSRVETARAGTSDTPALVSSVLHLQTTSEAKLNFNSTSQSRCPSCDPQVGFLKFIQSKSN